MNTNSIKEQLVNFGKALGEIASKKTFSIHPEAQQKLENAVPIASHKNPWFSEENVRFAMKTWSEVLDKTSVEKWLNLYSLGQNERKKIGIISAGNIPLVGLHDLICTWATGHEVHVKFSSEDSLMPVVLELVKAISGNPDLFVEHKHLLKNADAYIATGSDNSARYFDYYFGKYPHIIRKNRNSVAILNGEESADELKGLAEDIFRYFGLGCRSVSKIFIPRDYDFQKFFAAMIDHQKIVEHNRYGNNYDYYRTIYMLSQLPIWENGFMVLKEDQGYSSPVAVVFYEYYDRLEDVQNELNNRQEEIQCIVGKGHLPFGTTQKPSLSDYADGVDTMQFLLNV